MIGDGLARFSTAQSLISGAGTLTSTSSYDQGVAKEPGPGQTLFFFATITTKPVDASTAATLEIQLVTSASGTALSSPLILWSSTARTSASMVLGYTFVVPVPALPQATQLEFIGVLYVIAAGTGFSAGAITSGLVMDAPDQHFYPNGFTIAG